MKHFMKFVAVSMLLVTFAPFPAQAQGYGDDETKGWSTIWVEWNPSKFVYDIDDADSKSFTGISLGYSRAISLSSKIPLFIEPGIGVQYSFKTEDLDITASQMDRNLSDDDADPKSKFTMWSAKIPINLEYAWHIPNSAVTIIPFAGVNLRFNIVGKQKKEWNWSSNAISHWDFVWGGSKWRTDEKNADIQDTDQNIFDEDDMGEDNAYKRFQIGWNAGVKARFGKSFLLGVSYGTDFNEIAEKTKINTLTVSLGYTF